MSSNIEITADLLMKYLYGQLSEKEQAELDAWLNEAGEHRAKFDELVNKRRFLNKVRIFQTIEDRKAAKWEQLHAERRRQPLLRKLNTRIRPVFSVAAAVAAIVVGSYFLWFRQPQNRKEASPVAVSRFKNDVAPGINKAILTLSDGTTIILDRAHNGTLARQGNVQIVKIDSGQLVYTLGGAGSGAIRYNTITTPLGGQYQVTLPDGTKVWLNAGSSLYYPTAFTGPDRTVELTGEAYFEVAKNTAIPFKVKTRTDTEIKVLGTHFNIMAYEDEPAVATTLLEGSVRVGHRNEFVHILPGQQAAVGTSDSITVKPVNGQRVIAWKNGYFQFYNENIRTVMHQVSRWYDVDVSYQGNLPDGVTGTLPRSVSLTRLLTLLEQTGMILFEVEGRHVRVIAVIK